MLNSFADRPSGRLPSAIGVAAVHATLGWLLIGAIGVDLTGGTVEALKSFDVRTVEPPPPVSEVPVREAERLPARSPDMASAAPAPAGEAAAGPVQRETFWAVPMPMAPDGGAASSGLEGSGSGSGEQGSGTGSGGSGEGGGGGGGAAVRAELLSGRITPEDYPPAAVAARAEGAATVRFWVGEDGRVRDCRVMRSSGHEALDAATCALVEARFRWSPARDAAGHPVAEERAWRQSWWLTRGARAERRLSGEREMAE